MSVERDKAREIHSGLSNKGLEYLAKEFTFYTKRGLEVFKSSKVGENEVKIRFVL